MDKTKGRVGRPKTDAYYVETIGTLAAEGWTNVADVARELVRIAREDGRDDCPSYKTTKRIYDEWMARPENVLRAQGYVRWPKTMELGLLPWEAGRAVLDLLRYRHERGIGHPTVRHAQWYYRLTLAAPGMPTEEADWIAGYLATLGVARQAQIPVTGEVTALEWRLAYQPWRSDADMAAYNQAGEPEGWEPYPTRVAKLSTSSPEVIRAHLHAQFGADDGEKLYQQVFSEEQTEMLNSTYPPSDPQVRR